VYKVRRREYWLLQVNAIGMLTFGGLTLCAFSVLGAQGLGEGTSSLPPVDWLAVSCGCLVFGGLMYRSSVAGLELMGSPIAERRTRLDRWILLQFSAFSLDERALGMLLRVSFALLAVGAALVIYGAIYHLDPRHQGRVPPWGPLLLLGGLVAYRVGISKRALSSN
jgi:hypothetical protein